jgi:transcription termination/antitermination protein NusG
MGLRGRSCGRAEIPPNNTLAYSAWFEVQTLSKHEKVVRGQLQKRNIEYFLPTIKRFNHCTDRKKEVEIPLFAGYCFVRLAWEDRLAVLQSQGVARLVGCMGRPEPIPEYEIDSLRTLAETHRAKLVAHPYLAEGMLVEVVVPAQCDIGLCKAC